MTRPRTTLLDWIATRLMIWAPWLIVTALFGLIRMDPSDQSVFGALLTH